MVEVIFGLIIIALIAERYLFARHMTVQLEKSMKAVMSRNITDYLTATNEPKKDSGFIEEETIDLADASEEEFLKGIKKDIEKVL
jgi:hypothetical protein